MYSIIHKLVIIILDFLFKYAMIELIETIHKTTSTDFD